MNTLNMILFALFALLAMINGKMLTKTFQTDYDSIDHLFDDDAAQKTMDDSTVIEESGVLRAPQITQEEYYFQNFIEKTSASCCKKNTLASKTGLKCICKP